MNGGLRRVLAGREAPVAGALVVVLAVTTAVNPRFLSDQGRFDLLVAIAITGLMAVGQTFVLVMRHVDLSVGSVLGLSAFMAGSAVRGDTGGSLLVALLVGVVVGVVAGLVNGALVAFLRLPALVVTLGTLYVFQGVQALLTGGTRINADQLPASVVSFGVTGFLGVPWLMWVCLLAAAVGGVFLRTRRSGRDLYAVGSNPPAAELVGIPVARRTLLAYMVSGACAGGAGVLFLARFGGVDSNAGIGYELPVVAACVVGGVDIFGGSGTVLGALLGAMLLKTMGVSLSALSVPEFWQQAINGLLLLVAITADRIVLLRRERSARVEAARHRREHAGAVPDPPRDGADRAGHEGATTTEVVR
ncbi:ABC transporter permease [Kineosporia sp. A_224]|uniref:ABC transporter permease n=1 Tax=Kineosporia sp. A_224 TaxID=1962180 RepID=UPI000B4B36E5|nr:ABC transporter permease [Kineosporia sp. A_224]